MTNRPNDQILDHYVFRQSGDVIHRLGDILGLKHLRTRIRPQALKSGDVDEAGVHGGRTHNTDTNPVLANFFVKSG